MDMKVLVVDDDPAIVDVVTQVLDDEGFDVMHAHNGREALSEIKENHPDVVLSDVRMPALDGVALTRMLREHGDFTPVVLMSAVYSGVDLPGVRFLPKPFDVDQLISIVRRASTIGDLKSFHA